MLGSARVLQSIFNSDYHGLQLSADKRGNRFSAKAYYSYGKAMEDLDYQGGGLPAVQNSSKIKAERGRTSADRTQSFVLSGVWKLILQRCSAIARALATTGPFLHRDLAERNALTITSGLDRNLDGVTTDRADLVATPNSTTAATAYNLSTSGSIRRFRAACRRHRRQFSRSIVVGPGYATSTSDHSRHPRDRQMTFQVRLEATNVLNTIISRTLASISTLPRRSQIRSARDMRRIQLGVRYRSNEVLMRSVTLFVAGIFRRDHAAVVAQRELGRCAESRGHQRSQLNEASGLHRGAGTEEAFTFRDNRGRPLSYLQINKDTFLELQEASADRPVGFIHIGLEVGDLRGSIGRFRQGGLHVDDPNESARTKALISQASGPNV